MKSLKELREYNNLTQKEVAQHIGVSDRVYSYYEKGRTLPAKYVKPLANLFSISCDEFLENNTEELDWEREFGCIERTERLELPTWEEFVEMEEVCFWKKNHRQTVIRILGTKYIAVETSYERFFTGDLTKESYIKACRKAKELFLGEKK